VSFIESKVVIYDSKLPIIKSISLSS